MNRTMKNTRQKQNRLRKNKHDMKNTMRTITTTNQQIHHS